VPIFKDASVVGVLDVDSELLDQFDAVDQQYLEAIVALIQH
jgi:GAF domain-containing protein